jgi:methylenetetrahydrofolate reductase (NADPH)
VSPTDTKNSLIDNWSGGRSTLSFEFFPPKEESGIATTETVISDIASSTVPDFVTVTFGAGGTARGLSRRLVHFCTESLNLPTLAHITCRDLTIAEIDQTLSEYHEAGAFGILGLRGDPPKGSTVFTPHPEGFESSCDLIKHIADRKQFLVAVAGYPEKHRDAPTMAADIEFLKRKIDAGASVIMTQLFFDNEHFYRYCDELVRLGIHAPVLAGIMPVANLAQLTRFIGFCGATIPNGLMQRLEAVKDSPDDVAKIGTDHAIEQCHDLLAHGVKGLHFYTLNRPQQIIGICRGLGLNRGNS